MNSSFVICCCFHNFVLFLLLSCVVPHAFACCPHGNLRVKGTHLADEKGETVQLRGMSLYWSQWEYGSKFFNEKTVNCLKCSWHADIVRAPLAVDQGGYLSNPEQEYAKVKSVVQAAIDKCIYVLIDWHYTSSEKYTDKAKEFFGRISTLCAGKCNCLYETWNEPIQNDWSSQLKPYHEELVKVIRQNDKNGVIIAGTPNYDQDVKAVVNDPIKEHNIMYTLHLYAASHKQELRNTAQQAIGAGVPLFVTEYGTSSYTGDGGPDLVETQNWYDFFNKNSLSYINWAIDDKQEASVALQNTQPPVGPADVCSTDRLTKSGKFVHDHLIGVNQKPDGC
uniref:Putative gland protein G26D05 n=1 Tax=Heterodera glycines TaxID=51029 RepID=Q86DQ0_HETGL|nr:putative gland protein G26D05 [Heterodera glycines]